jgi:hypothetical protein
LYDEALLRRRSGAVLRPGYRALFRPRRYTLFRLYETTLFEPGGRVPLRRFDCTLLRLRDGPRRGTFGCAQLFDTPTIALLDTSEIDAASASGGQPRILGVVEPGPLGTRKAPILPVEHRVQLLIKSAQPRILADYLLVRGAGVAAIECLRMRCHGAPR